MAVILIVFWITAMCMTGIQSCEGRDEAEVECSTFTVVKCGDPRGRFKLTYCSPRDKDYEKINSVHLDTRYPNRYCIRDNQEIFGMTADANKMWVSDFCHGTFCVCLQPAINKNRTSQEDRNKSNITNDKRRKVDKRNETVDVVGSTTPVAKHITAINKNQKSQEDSIEATVNGENKDKNKDDDKIKSDKRNVTVDVVNSTTIVTKNITAFNKNQTRQEYRNGPTANGEHQYNNTDNDRIMTTILANNMTDSPTTDMLNVTEKQMQLISTEGTVNKTQTSTDSTHNNLTSSGNLSTANCDFQAIYMDPIQNYIPMICIILGGFVLGLLLITIACLCFNPNTIRKGKGPAVTQPVVFKEQSLSSSTLVPTELLNDAPLYEIIPADRIASYKTIPLPN